MAGITDYTAHVYSSGLVKYFFPAVIKTACRVNVRYFPFDIQQCNLKFGSWSYHGNSPDISPGASDMSSYFENSEWAIKEMPVKRHVLPEPYPDVNFYLHLKRRPYFFLLTLIFPCILVALGAAPQGFILPVESGEKVSLEITVLLSLAVFMLVVTETMPPSSDNFPILGTYFATSMTMVGLSCVQTVVVLNVFYRGADDRQVPRWAKVYVIGYLGRLLCLKRHGNKVGESCNVNQRSYQKGIRPEDISQDKTNSRRKDRNNPLDQSDQESITHVEIMDARDVQPRLAPRILPSISPGDLSIQYKDEHFKCLKKVSEFIANKRTEDEINSDWRDVANTLDRLFLLTYIVMSVAIFFGFMIATITQ